MSSIEHPDHYGGKDSPYETIKVIKAWGLGFHLGNALKYISRAGKKATSSMKEDLEKAIWYLNDATTVPQSMLFSSDIVLQPTDNENHTNMTPLDKITQAWQLEPNLKLAVESILMYRILRCMSYLRTAAESLQHNLDADTKKQDRDKAMKEQVETLAALKREVDALKADFDQAEKEKEFQKCVRVLCRILFSYLLSEFSQIHTVMKVLKSEPLHKELLIQLLCKRRRGTELTPCEFDDFHLILRGLVEEHGLTPDFLLSIYKYDKQLCQIIRPTYTWQQARDRLQELPVPEGVEFRDTLLSVTRNHKIFV